MTRTPLLLALCILTAPALRAQPGRRPASTSDDGVAIGTLTAAGTIAPPRRGAVRMPTEITLQREAFAYRGTGRRDPYTSLMTSSDIRPLLSDLRLTAVAFDPSGANSVAILRDDYAKRKYRVRVGQQLGRLRITTIKQRSVQFTLEEFGFNRTESLALSTDSTRMRLP